MSKNCELFRDLYDLYKDGICSEDSNRFVEEHLNECEECRKLIQAKKDGVPVVSKDKKVLRKVKRRLSAKAGFIICFFLAFSLLSVYYVGLFHPELFEPPCIAISPDVEVLSSANHISDEDVETIIKELKKTMRTSDHFNGSVLKEIKLYTSLREMKYHNTFPDKKYKGVAFDEEIMIDCRVHYYLRNGTFPDMNMTMLFGAALLDGEWIIIPLEVHF